jgi:dTDP-4-dehydrorhamnose 3,5-epimerase
MNFVELEVPGVWLIEPKVFGDNRGWFFESYRHDEFAAHGLSDMFVQDNMSSSAHHVVRGLHYQLEPKAQDKLVRVTRGEVFDVAVDIRKGSPTFGKWAGRILSAENKLAMFVPAGCAHGFCVLSDTAEFHYRCTGYYAPSHERGIHWDDPAIGVEWPVEAATAILSDKDKRNPPLAQAEINYEWKAKE